MANNTTKTKDPKRICVVNMCFVPLCTARLLFESDFVLSGHAFRHCGSGFAHGEHVGVLICILLVCIVSIGLWVMNMPLLYSTLWGGNSEEWGNPWGNISFDIFDNWHCRRCRMKCSTCPMALWRGRALKCQNLTTPSHLRCVGSFAPARAYNFKVLLIFKVTKACPVFTGSIIS